MAESLSLSSSLDKNSKYKHLLPQIEGLIASEANLTANLANISAALKEAMDFFWVGFYIVKNDELVLGPFQGPIACTRIKKGKGVCGTVWENKKAKVVGDVDAFPGHISCNSESKSEIVLPAFFNNEVALILDVDSDQLNGFDDTDMSWLQEVIDLLEKKLTY